MTFAEAVDAWEQERLGLGVVEPYTAKRSAQDERRWNKYVGDMEIDEIKPFDVSRFLVDMRQHGAKDGGPLCGTTLNKSFKRAKAVVKWAINYELATKNAFDKVPSPQVSDHEAKFLSPEEAQRMAQLVIDGMRNSSNESHRSCYIAVFVALMTGMRRGEVFALRWDNVNLDNGVIRVDAAMKGGNYLGKPKTRSSVRNIAIGAQASAELRLVRDIRGGYGYLISKDGGDTMLPMPTFDHWWCAWRESNGFGRLRYHELRHTQATLLIAAGTDIKTVQHRLGHSSADITLNVYAHVLPNADRGAANLFDGAVLGGKSLMVANDTGTE